MRPYSNLIRKWALKFMTATLCPVPRITKPFIHCPQEALSLCNQCAQLFRRLTAEISCPRSNCSSFCRTSSPFPKKSKGLAGSA